MNTLYFSLEAPLHYFIVSDVNGRNSLLDEGMFNDYEEISLKSDKFDQIVGFIPGEMVSIYDVEMPIKSRKQATLAIPFALEDQLASNINDVEFFILNWRPNGVSSVAVIAKEYWLKYIDQLADSKVSLNQIIPDYALLSLPDEASAVIFSEQGTDRILIRSRQGSIEKGLTLNKDELAFWADDFDAEGKNVICNDDFLISELSNVESINAEFIHEASGNSLSDICVNMQESQVESLSLLSLYSSDQSEQTIEKLKPWLLGVVCLIALTFISIIGFDIYEYTILKKQNQELEQRIESIFEANFPSVDRIVDARLQFQREIDALKGNSRGSQEFLHLLDQSLKALPKNVAKVTELHYKESALDIVFTANNFQVLDRFEKNLSKFKHTAFKRVSSYSQGGKVSAKYRFSRSDKGVSNE